MSAATGTSKCHESAQGSPFFTRLPREIRDQIYSYAYGQTSCDFKIISLSRWMKNERNRRRHTAVAAAIEIPVCPLLQMRVSHQYFNEAASNEFRMRTIVCSDPEELFKHSSTIMKDNVLSLDILWKREYISNDSYSLARSIFSRLSIFTSLKRLRVRVLEDVFDPIETKLSCAQNLEDDELRGLASVQAMLTNLCGHVESIELVPLKSLYSTCPSEIKQWEKNVAELQKIINVEIAKHRPVVAETSMAKQQKKTISPQEESLQDSVTIQQIKDSEPTASVTAQNSSVTPPQTESHNPKTTTRSVARPVPKVADHHAHSKSAAEISPQTNEGGISESFRVLRVRPAFLIKSPSTVKESSKRSWWLFGYRR